MRNLILLLVIYFQFQIGFAQINETITGNVISKDSISFHHETANIINASYKGGITNFYNYIGTNYNFNNIKKEDILKEFYANEIMTVFLKFTISEEGIPMNFEAINTTSENSFYKEAVRVISSTRWTPAKKDDVAISQEFTIPIKAYIEEL